MISLSIASMLLSPDVASDALRIRVETAPRKVAAFVERRANCNHFTGEEGYDAERSAYLRKTIRELKCARIDRDERRLRQAYRNRPEILRLLEDSEGLLGW